MSAADIPLPSAMRAWQYSTFGGGADALELNPNLPVPRPGPGQLLVKLQAASVNPVDWKLQSGVGRPFVPPHVPCTPGFDVAGEVVAVGNIAGPVSAQAPGLGDRVMGMLSTAGGACAEFALVSTSSAARLPSSVSFAVGSCLGVAAVTALQFLRDYGGLDMGPVVEGTAGATPESKAGSRPRKNVLITNGSGGVGHYAVQLARLAGAHVTATCGARTEEWVRSLGADEVLDYKTKDGAALLSPSGVKYDIVFDGTTTTQWSTVRSVLAPTGKWVHLTPNPTILRHAVLSMLPFFQQKVLTGFAKPVAQDLATVARLTAEGHLKTRVEEEFPFSKAPEAWRKIMEGHVTGKVVIVMDS